MAKLQIRNYGYSGPCTWKSCSTYSSARTSSKIKLATNLLHFQKTPSPYLRVMFFKTALVANHLGFWLSLTQQMLIDVLIILGWRMTCGVNVSGVLFFHLSLRKEKMPDHRLLLYVQTGLFCHLRLVITDQINKLAWSNKSTTQELNFIASASGRIFHHDLGYRAKPCLLLAFSKGQRH